MIRTTLLRLYAYTILTLTEGDIDQMKEGLHTPGVATAIKAMPETFLSIFTSSEETLLQEP